MRDIKINIKVIMCEDFGWVQLVPDSFHLRVDHGNETPVSF
jgi:hypothetical protein